MNEMLISDKKARLDVFLAERLSDYTRSAIVKMLNNGNCKVNGIVVTKSFMLKENDKIEFTIPEAISTDVLPSDIPLEILYEDSDILVVNKAKGMVVHPAPGHISDTLVNALMYHCGDSLSGINGEIRPGIVHRIDKNTSGILVVAKNDKAHFGLSRQIKEHSMIRQYEAVVTGVIKENGIVDAPLGRNKFDRKKQCVTEDGRDAVTHYEILENFKNYTYLLVTLETGRTHQIRVHMRYIGHPLAGDDVYGSGKPLWLQGQCLHAKRLGFVHPTTGEKMDFETAVPEVFNRMLRLARSE